MPSTLISTAVHYNSPQWVKINSWFNLNINDKESRSNKKKILSVTVLFRNISWPEWEVHVQHFFIRFGLWITSTEFLSHGIKATM